MYAGQITHKGALTIYMSRNTQTRRSTSRCSKKKVNAYYSGGCISQRALSLELVFKTTWTIPGIGDRAVSPNAQLNMSENPGQNSWFAGVAKQ